MSFERWPRPGEDGVSDASEVSREDLPLRLLAEFSSAWPHAWHPVVLDEDRRSFSFHWPKAISEERSQSYFERLLEVAPWVELRNTKGTSVTRSTCWYCTGGCTCDYAYGQQTRVESPGFNRLFTC
ncbi:YrdC-like domain-containing protein [Durusdinium trenchii]|uniref:YrdC-like domain-containing protein n=1 Tax=Durusdinium trenchii TaxID=1381693 RepID=A0ABP0PBA2_9DINO